MKQRLGFVVGLVLLIVTACSGGSAPSTPAPSAGTTPGPVLSLPQLKLALQHQYGALWYCDPDFYPLQRGEEIDSARERWPEVVADTESFTAILADLGLKADASFTDQQKLAVYQEWKHLAAIALDPVGNDTFRFDYLAMPPAGAAQGTRTGGTITTHGAITVEQKAPASQPMCPICLARGTRIEAPSGPIAVERLRIGDEVWTLDAAGRRVAGTVVAVGSTPAPVNHHVVHLVLADGRTVTASPGHPLADGRRLGALKAGDVVDGTAVVTADLVPYSGGETFDLLVSGPTGSYLVDGIPLGSTLRP